MKSWRSFGFRNHGYPNRSNDRASLERPCAQESSKETALLKGF
jgi:hypothetical protein